MNTSIIKTTKLHFLGFLVLLLIACEKNQSKPSNGDVSQVKIEEILKNGTDIFERLIKTETEEQAKEELLDELLESDDVQSGKTIDQGIYLTFSDGTQGGIMLNGNDDPEFNEVPETPERESLDLRPSVQSKSQPVISNTIFLNPHYSERKRYADWLINKYKIYFPVAGYEEPEIYINEECTLDKFASLGNYGIIHIYSHGIKISDQYVLLLTGEPLNIATTTKYSEDIKANKILRFRLMTGKNVYVITPDFIKDNNDFKDKNKLVFGGFCYSFLGGWPQMFYDGYEGGYFGFSNSVYTDKNVKWAEDLFYNLSNPYNFEPKRAIDWRNTTALNNTYTDDKGEDVSIKYMGLTDLALWKWETTIWNFKYFRFSIKVNALLEKEDLSTVRRDNYLLHECTGTGTFNVDTFIGKSQHWDNDGRKSTGSMRFVVDPFTYKISNFEISDTTIASYLINETDMMHCKINEIPYVSSLDPFVDGADFMLKGEAITDKTKSLTDFYYLEKDSVISWDSIVHITHSEKLLDYMVDENSEIKLELLPQR